MSCETGRPLSSPRRHGHFSLDMYGPPTSADERPLPHRLIFCAAPRSCAEPRSSRNLGREKSCFVPCSGDRRIPVGFDPADVAAYLQHPPAPSRCLLPFADEQLEGSFLTAEQALSSILTDHNEVQLDLRAVQNKDPLFHFVERHL